MKHLVFDIETWSADMFYRLPAHEFVRLVGLSWAGTGHVDLTTDLDTVRSAILSADRITGHNIHSFDIPAVFGVDSTVPVELADQGRVFDTFTHAALVFPAPERYTDRTGVIRYASSPAKAMRWFSLDELAFQLGITGKVDDLHALAHEFGNPDLGKRARTDDGYGRIPVTDPRYRAYLTGDVTASEALAAALISRFGEPDPYAWREQRIEARKTRIALNGFRVDQDAASRRIRHQTWRRWELVNRLAGEYGFPTEGAKPWATAAGRAAIMDALEDHGITPNTVTWPRTAAGQPSLGGRVILELTRGTSAADLGADLAELQGQRALAQLALDETQPDGKAHPSITMLQRSGRWSTTKPGLTVWSERDKTQRLEKEVFIPDNDDEVLLELDYSAADARIVAALSGDKQYATLFGDEEKLITELTGDPGYVERVFTANHVGLGAHAINAILAFGAATVATNPKHYRNVSKALGHAWNYGAGAHRLSITSGQPLPVADKFCRGLARAYPALTRWQDQARRYADNCGYVTNPWGRKMRVERGREFTQAPALLGQSGTREIVCDAILRMPLEILTRVKAQIHDAVLVSVPKDRWEEYRDQLVDLMQSTINPTGKLEMQFPVSCGPAASNWADAGH